MRRTASFLNQERRGFAITFEISMCMLLVAIVSSVTIYFTQLLETERYLADVTAATCTMASRYGGNDSKAYAIQVGGGNIEDNANLQLKYILSKNNRLLLDPYTDGKYITVSDAPDANGNVTVRLKYKLSSTSWGNFVTIFAPNNWLGQSITLPSLMQRGALI